MRKSIIALFLVVAAWLWLPEVARADEPIHTITMTTNISTTLGCARYYSSTWNIVEAAPGYQAVCTSTAAHEYVGVVVGIDTEQLDTWDYTTAPISKTNTLTDVWADWYHAVYWDGTAYTGTNWVTYTVSMLEPTPTPTPTIDPTEYSEEYALLDMPNRVYLPFVAGGSGGGNTNPSDDYDGDTTWWDWAQDIEAFFAPVFERIATVRMDIEELHEGACGTPWTAFTPPLDPTSGTPELYMLEGQPTATLTAYVMGVSIGRPMAWIRSIQESNSILGLNFFVMLIYFLAAGIGWIVFVSVITYSARLIRWAVELIVKIYELIPFKAT
jgi:hypothetical protein